MTDAIQHALEVAKATVACPTMDNVIRLSRLVDHETVTALLEAVAVCADVDASLSERQEAVRRVEALLSSKGDPE